MRQSELAQKIGVTREHLNAVIRGRVNPGGKLAIRLARETGFPLELWLLGGAKERQAAWEKLKNGGEP